MSRRNEFLFLLVCGGVWLLMISRLRSAIAFNVHDAPTAQTAVAPRASVLHDVTLIGNQGAFRPLSGWTLPDPDSVTPNQVVFERPSLHLKGIMGGPPWAAVLSMHETGGEDRVMRAGDSLGTVVVREVRADGVTLRLQDSTWVITLLAATTP